MQGCGNIFKLYFLDFSSIMCGLFLQFGYTEGSDCWSASKYIGGKHCLETVKKTYHKSTQNIL